MKWWIHVWINVWQSQCRRTSVVKEPDQNMSPTLWCRIIITIIIIMLYFGSFLAQQVLKLTKRVRMPQLHHFCACRTWRNSLCFGVKIALCSITSNSWHSASVSSVIPLGSRGWMKLVQTTGWHGREVGALRVLSERVCAHANKADLSWRQSCHDN